MGVNPPAASLATSLEVVVLCPRIAPSITDTEEW